MTVEAAPSKRLCSCDGGSVCECGTKRMVISGKVGSYERLADILSEALDQAVSGKGAERHGSGESFADQPIMTIQRHLGDEGFALGQAAKKLFEANRLPGEAGDREILGAIVYAAAAVLRRREKRTERELA